MNKILPVQKEHLRIRSQIMDKIIHLLIVLVLPPVVILIGHQKTIKISVKGLIIKLQIV